VIRALRAHAMLDQAEGTDRQWATQAEVRVPSWPRMGATRLGGTPMASM
jgi:hypothetical protein